MGIFSGCLLAADADETLVTNGVVPQRNNKKIKFFVENGGVFSLATGRVPCAARCVAEQLDTLSTSIFGNGCIAYNLDTREALFEYLLDSDDVKAAKKAKELFSGVGIQCFYREDTYVFNRTDRTDEHTAYEKIVWKPLSEAELHSLKFNKMLYHCENFEHAEQLKKALLPVTKNSDFINSSFVINGVRRHMLEQVPRGVSKAAGVLKLAKLLNIKKGCIYAIGDYFNDLDMLKAADISAATYGAPDEIKAVADITVCSVEDGAVADFIDYLTNHLGN